MTSVDDFDLAIEPWIRVLYADGAERAVGLEQTLLDAHLITDLALPHPAAYGALYRILAAIAYRVTGLDRPPGGDLWYRRRNALFAEPFDAEVVKNYFADPAHSFSLYGPRPFLQDPRLREDCKKTSGINKLVFGRAAGSNRPWFAGKSGDGQQHPVPSEQAALHLLMWAYYGSGGALATRTHGPLSTQSGCPASPLRGTIGYHPLGPDLRTTVLAHLTAPTVGVGQAASRPDVAPWEHSDRADPTRPAPPPTGPVSLLSARSRHALLLVPGPDGRTAVDSYITWGARNSPQSERPKTGDYVEPHPDPFLSYRRSKNGAASSAVEADGGRTLFRDLDVLLNSPDSRSRGSGTRPTRPLALHACDYLSDEVIETLRLRVVGVQQDRSQAVDRQWWTTTTPPLLAHSFRRDPETAEDVEHAIRQADTAAWHLDRALATAFNDKPKDSDARNARQGRIANQYWPRASTVFWDAYDGRNLVDVRRLMRRAALDAFDHLTAAMALSPSAGRRVAQGRAQLPLPGKKTDSA